MVGAPAVEPLRKVVDEGSERAALAACLGLTRTGKQGGMALTSIADKHPTPSVRAFASLAIGRSIGERNTVENPGD
jgi:hypothetical protein